MLFPYTDEQMRLREVSLSSKATQIVALGFKLFAVTLGVCAAPMCPTVRPKPGLRTPVRAGWGR